MTLRFLKSFNPLSNYSTGSEGGVDNMFGENVICLMTIESKVVNHLGNKLNIVAFVFEIAEVTTADSNVK